MIELPFQWIDRAVIRLAAANIAPAGPARDQGTRMRALIESPEFLGAPEINPPELLWTSPDEFWFDSPAPVRYASVNRVRGRFFPSAGNWRTRPAMVMIHGWNADYCYRWLFPPLARELARNGVNALMFELPFHGSRRPHERGAVRNFISDDLVLMIEATRQAVVEARALLAWAASCGCARSGIWGFSLGAWLAGLAASADAKAQVNVLTTPIPRLEEVIYRLPFCAPIRPSFECSRARIDSLDMAARPACGEGARTLLVEALFDLFVPPGSVEALHRAWRGSELWRVRHGHISVLLDPWHHRRTIHWIREASR